MTDKTLIITSPDPWRPLMYYLKNYKVWAISALVTDNIRLKETVIKSYNWNFQETIVKNQSLTIPSEINTIVFTDDEATNWLKNSNKKIINLAGNSSITVLSILNKSKIQYKLGTIIIQTL
jgi:hypothetical protein